MSGRKFDTNYILNKVLNPDGLNVRISDSNKIFNMIFDEENNALKIKIDNLAEVLEGLGVITNVDLTGLADGNALVYNAATETWIPYTIPSFPTGVTTTVPTLYGLLFYTDGLLTEYRDQFVITFFEENGMEGVKVEVYQDEELLFTEFTDELGIAEITLTNGEYNIVITKNGYNEITETITVKSAEFGWGFEMVEDTGLLYINSTDDVEGVNDTDFDEDGFLKIMVSNDTLIEEGDRVLLSHSESFPLVESEIVRITDVILEDDGEGGFLTWLVTDTKTDGQYASITKLTSTDMLINPSNEVLVETMDATTFIVDGDYTNEFQIGTIFGHRINATDYIYDIVTKAPTFKTGKTTITSVVPYLSSSIAVRTFELPS